MQDEGAEQLVASFNNHHSIELLNLSGNTGILFKESDVLQVPWVRV